MRTFLCVCVFFYINSDHLSNVGLCLVIICLFILWSWIRNSNYSFFFLVSKRFRENVPIVRASRPMLLAVSHQNKKKNNR